MINPVISPAQTNPAIANTTPAQPTAKATASTPKPTPAQAPPTPVDTVQISTAARAIQEAIETPQQTAKEARGGDHQAQRLLAKEAAANKAE